jgi:branched-subunit amino acid aminotransferase/4-amino-4-deoxychorismate lyase
VSELASYAQDGSLAEVFGSGTAAIITSVERIGYKGDEESRWRSKLRMRCLDENAPVLESIVAVLDRLQRFAYAQDGSLAEVFGSGTAAIITSVERIGYKGDDVRVPSRSPRPAPGRRRPCNRSVRPT